jgi:hypothetical protein
MRDVLRATLWFCLCSGVLSVAIGVLTLGNRRVALFWQRRRMARNHWGWAQIIIGLGLALEPIPWLAGYTSGRSFVLALAGAVLFAVGTTLQLRAQLPRV